MKKVLCIILLFCMTSDFVIANTINPYIPQFQMIVNTSTPDGSYCLVYDESTKIVYLKNNIDSIVVNFYSENGKICKYDCDSGKMMEID